MILRRYIIREVLLTLVTVFGVLLLIFFSTRFVRILADVAAGALPADLVFTLLGLHSLRFLPLLFTIALFFAILLAFGRLYRDHEMVALAACGFGQADLAGTIMRLAPVVALVIGLCAVFLSPWAASRANDLQLRAKQESELSGLVAGQFRESRDGNFIIYVESIEDDKRTLHNVFVHNRKDSSQTVLYSATGYRDVDAKTGDEFMIMNDGYRYEGVPGQLDYRVIHFATHAIRVERKAEQVQKLARWQMSTAELWQTRSAKDLAELQNRLLMPISALVLALLAVPLSRSSPREGRYARLFSAVLIFIAYNNLLAAAQGWVGSGKLSPSIGMWWVPLLLLCITLLYIYLQNHNSVLCWPGRRARREQGA